MTSSRLHSDSAMVFLAGCEGSYSLVIGYSGLHLGGSFG